MALNKPNFNRGPRPPFKKKEAEHNINQFIRAQEVRLVGDNVEQGVYPIRQALAIAEEQELDLVEISPNAVPPVCKVIDYNKFVYEQKKKLKEIKNNAKQTVIKEIRFGPNTDDHDFDFKSSRSGGPYTASQVTGVARKFRQFDRATRGINPCRMPQVFVFTAASP